LQAIQNDEQARENWIAERITTRKEPTVHPPGCDRAARKWNNLDFEGKISQQNLREAAAEFEKVIEKDKRHMHAYSDAATIYEYLKQYGKAADIWRQGLRVSPGNQIAANNVGRLMLLEELHYGNPSAQRRVYLYNEIGVLYWRNRDLERAIHYFKKAVKEKPDHAMAWANLGANYIETGKYQEALYAIEYALKLNPNIEFGKQMKERLQWLQKVLSK
jgi:tetratricopeptide (TPR) repeat protein